MNNKKNVKYFIKLAIPIILIIILVYIPYIIKKIKFHKEIVKKSSNAIPLPTGTYSIGSTQYHLMDKNRRDMHSKDDNFRELILQVWYPTDRKNSEHINYFPKQSLNIVRNDISKACEINISDLNFLNALKSNSFGNVEISNTLSKYPIVIFIPGLGMPVNLYSNLHEELASRGYIIVAINFTYVTNPVLFPDGRIIESSKKIDKEKEFKVWIDDVNFVLNQLPHINSYGVLKGKLDLNKIGIYGHSFGGGVALKLCEINKELIAGADLDGKIREKQDEINKPFMFINSKQSKEDTDPLKELNQKNSSFGYFININDINHGTFTDLFLIINNCKDKPELNANEATKIIRQMIVNFFDKYLKNKNIDLTNILNHLARENPNINFDLNKKARKDL